jgi:chromosome segregation ATPase
VSRIIIKKLILQGTAYKRTLNFNDGLTIISGDKTSGKSLVLSLIDYCLGKSKRIDLNVQKELDGCCDQVFLELKIGNETITLNRFLKEKQTKISTYFCAFEYMEGYTPKTIEIKEVMHFLMRKLNINEYKLIKHQRHSSKHELETVSFRDIFRYVYIHQHELGTHDFLENKTPFKRNKNPHAFKLMFNLVEADKDDLKEQLIKAKNEIEDTNREIVGLKSYLKDKGAEGFNELLTKSDSYEKDIQKLKQEKQSIVQNSNTNSNNENEMYILLKKDLAEIANQIFDLQRQKKEFQISSNAKRLLIEEYNVEKAEIDATLEINYKLVVPNQNIECPLCSSMVLNQFHKETKHNIKPEKTLNKVKKEIINKINLVDNLITSDNKDIEEIDKKIAKLEKEQAILNKAITEFAKETDVPFLSQLDSINSIVNKLTKEQEMVKECVRIHRKVDEKGKHIIELGKEVTRLEKELEKLSVSEEDRKQIIEYLNTQYKKFMERLKYKTDGETYIHTEKYIPYYEGASVYEHESGGLLECMQLSYLAAILSSKAKGYAVGHPGVLLLDSLSKYLGTLKKDEQKEVSQDNSKVTQKDLINDPKVYEEIYEILIELSTNHQIIVVENTPLEKVDIYTKYTFLNGEQGLINPKMNEFREND